MNVIIFHVRQYQSPARVAFELFDAEALFGDVAARVFDEVFLDEVAFVHVFCLAKPQRQFFCGHFLHYFLHSHAHGLQFTVS